MLLVDARHGIVEQTRRHARAAACAPAGAGHQQDRPRRPRRGDPGDKPLRPGARLLLKHGARTTQVIVGALGGLLDAGTVSYVDAPDQLAVNALAAGLVGTPLALAPR